MKNITESYNKFDLNLESLRGYVAMSVVFNHIINFNEYLDPHYFPKLLKLFIPPGHLCVLVFFLLSGYVIEISHSGKNKLIKSNTIVYLKKRFIRLYPIYLLIILLTLLIAKTQYKYGTIFSNLFFTQNLLSPTIGEVGPIWSLNYEVLFYLLFIPISLLKIHPLKLIALSILIAVLFFFLTISDLSIISSYFIGLVFWVSGLVIARYLQKNEGIINIGVLLSNLFLLLALPILIESSIDYTFLNTSGKLLMNYPDAYRVKIRNLFFLPYCFIFVSNFTNRTFAKRKIFLAVLQLLPLLAFYPILLLIKGRHYSVFFGVLSYGISTILYFTEFNFIKRIATLTIKTGTWLGGISYALYLVHFPLLVLFSRISFFSGTVMTYIVRFILFLFILLYFSYFLEKRYQPFIKKFF